MEFPITSTRYDYVNSFVNTIAPIVVNEYIARKIKDSKFLNIIRQFLKAGYVENWKYNKTYSGKNSARTDSIS